MTANYHKLTQMIPAAAILGMVFLWEQIDIYFVT